MEPNEPEPADTEEAGSVLTKYAVNWHSKERPDIVRRTRSIVDSADMTRPGDPEQRDQIIRVQLASLLPIGQGPGDVILDTVDPICNCEPFPESANCLYREYQGRRFYLSASIAKRGHEVIHDRHGDKILGVVHNTLSVKFLTMVREEYGHQ
ncbi:hypothetical protein ACH4YO_40595 [Streptomyces noursei]|uniref:hypothetical protein n=1 Tax=Streptomyces noursei TaxID=1971 RepID=UPI00081C3E22|nr:hypothetical protein SNOUR_00140 [Streptomyces noursei ATCC 11455]ANZ21984.1 hypothetical protein SNOUR_43810 [Streptomyces noursei ATCC 11455]MCZ0996434.1 hypothetical protein [Streptomyces noursei]